MSKTTTPIDMKALVIDLAAVSPALVLTMNESKSLEGTRLAIYVDHNPYGCYGPDDEGHYEVLLYVDYEPHWVLASADQDVAMAAARILVRATGAEGVHTR